MVGQLRLPCSLRLVLVHCDCVLLYYAPEFLGMLWRQAPHAAEGRDVNSESYTRSRKQTVSLKRRSVTKRVRYTGGLSNTPSKTSPIINDLLIRLSRSCSPAVDIRARISTAGVPCCSRVGSRMNSLPRGLSFRASMSTFSCRWSSSTWCNTKCTTQCHRHYLLCQVQQCHQAYSPHWGTFSAFFVWFRSIL